ncbi:MAG: hypothetical protein RSE27_05950 [Ruthenibacterium sp.]
MPIKSFFEDAAQEKQDVPQADAAQPANVGQIMSGQILMSIQMWQIRFLM